MKIGKYISELLFEKDFVVLPEFGNFSTKYVPARFVPESKKVEKPSKVVAFSNMKKDDDNVLSDYIAKNEKITPEKAKSFISAFVKKMNDTLKSGKSVELESIGKFSPGVGENINFEPDKSINYLSESAGLDSIKEPDKKPGEASEPKATKEEKKPSSMKEPDKKDQATKTTSESSTTSKEEKKEPEKTKPETAKTPEKTEHVNETKTQDIPKKEEKPLSTGVGIERESEDKEEPRLSPGMKWVAFVVIPLLVIIIVIAFNYKYLVDDPAVPEKESVSFVDRIKGIFTDAESPEMPAIDEVEEVDPIVSEDEEVSADQDSIPDPKMAEPKVVEQPHEPVDGAYHIIVGSFMEEHNAEILLENLRNEGASASMFGRSRDGHFRVSYGAYGTLQEAENELHAVKQRVGDNAWILKK